MDQTKYFLGVDAGGTKTYTLITDQRGVIRGKGQSGNGNYQVNLEQARRNIDESTDMALRQAGLERGEIDFALFGLAGADREIDYSKLRPMVRSFGFPRHDIVCDTMIALRAGTDRPYGVVLICGSGTNSAGRNRRGDTFQCGGYSYPFGDFGGGGMLAGEVFRTVIRADDGRERPTLLTNLLLDYLGYASVREMFDDYMDHQKSVPIHATKLLFQAAAKGDAAAMDILQKQGEEMGKSACAVIRRLGMERESFDVVLAGSILARGEGPFVNAFIEQAVRRTAPGAKIVKLNVEPVVGAVWMAMESAGEPVSREAYDRLRAVSDYRIIQV